MPAEVDERFMRIALREAWRAAGLTSPNPAVGAVLVAGNRVLSRGHHRKAGAPHAEIECLHGFRGKLPRGATLYVTLEPCSTIGRTAACLPAIVKAGIRTIVIGTTDLNPRHSGRGMALLQDAGIDVRTGVLDDECRSLNEAFNKWITTGLPFVVAKCGMTLDGRLTRPPGESRWLTSPASRRDANALRANVDAILVGAETIRIDNPRLTVRGVRGKTQPLRVILSRSGRLPKTANVFTDRYAKRTVIYRNKSLRTILKELGRREITSVLIEGGSEILSQALDERLIDKVQLYVAPLLTGGDLLAFSGRGAGSTAAAVRLNRITYRKIGNDIRVTCYPAYPNGTE
jgi:diaminohydroxyphosphoribosylaminopyrimidine deaminase/5-amino-6-(5-phosphoribosylamino)uracil reductase